MNEFVKSLKRLYDNKLISQEKIIQLYKNNKINEEDRKYILDI